MYECKKKERTKESKTCMTYMRLNGICPQKRKAKDWNTAGLLLIRLITGFGFSGGAAVGFGSSDLDLGGITLFITTTRFGLRSRVTRGLSDETKTNTHI